MICLHDCGGENTEHFWANGSVKLVIVIVLLRLFSTDFQMNPYQKKEFQKGLNIQY